MRAAIFTLSRISLLLLLLLMYRGSSAQFVHPGGVHTQADLDRMKAKVAAGAHPWIDGWNLLIQDYKAQNNYVAIPSSTVGGSDGTRQQAANDATAAYFNFLRWYITGDTSYANCAVRILNAWSSSVNAVVTGELFQLPTTLMVQAGELLRTYPGWAPADFARFKNMCLNYFYPACHSFLGQCGSWPSWDMPCVATICYIGVLCDDTAKFNEAVNYYQNGAGGGALVNNVVSPTGQLYEIGRDQAHAEIGPEFAAEMCQTAWNQGVDLFSLSNNRLLAGFEYYCQYNLNHAVNWSLWNDCTGNLFFYPSLSLRDRISVEPTYELVYNHYAVTEGLSAPYTRAMINLRGLQGTTGQYIGYCALTYNLSDTTTVFQAVTPPAPTGLTATPGIANIDVKWTAPPGDVANGYNIMRATASGGPYTMVASWSGNTATEYWDTAVKAGTTYYYEVSAMNQAGTSGNSAAISAAPLNATGTLMPGWARADIGTVATPGTALYANGTSQCITMKASGNNFGSTSGDSYGYVYTQVAGDFTISVHLANIVLSGTDADRAGLVMRESMNTNAALASISNGDDAFRSIWFATHATGGNTSWVHGDTHSWTPLWYKLQRSGNTFTGYQSQDGVNWFQVGSTTIAMDTSYYVGLMVLSGSTTPSVLTTATFDHLITVGGGSVTPGAPTGLKAAAGNTQDTLSWSAVNGAAAYDIKRDTVSGGPYTTVASGVTGTSFLDTGLVNGKTYYYVVAAANIAGEGPNSAEVSATPMLSVPPVPLGVSAASVGATRVLLQWSPSVSTATYNIKRATVSGGPYTVVSSVTGTSYTDSALVMDSAYYYVVSAVNAVGESANSTQVEAAPGRVSYWKFDENTGTTAYDSWGANNGTLSSGVTWTTGAINSGVRFDGTGNISLPPGIVSQITSFTVAGWIRLDAQASWQRIFDFGTSSSTDYMFLAQSNTGGLQYAITTAGGGGQQTINYNTPVPLGNWTYVAVTWSGDTAILYVNGVEVGRNNNVTLNPSSLGNTLSDFFGHSQYSGDPQLTGALDEIRLYSRALSAAEVHNLSVLNVPPAAPVSVSIVGGNNTASLTWSMSAGATGYNVKRGVSAIGPFTTIANVSGTSYIDSTAFNCTNYFYVVSAVDSVGEGVNSNVVSVATGSKQTGRLIGTPGSWGDNPTTTNAAAVDGNVWTFFDAPTSVGWVGYAFGADSGMVVNQIRYAPRLGYEWRMVGGMFQGANDSLFSNPDTLFTVTTAPTAGLYTTQAVTSTKAYQYVRYISPVNGWGDVGEVEFDGILGGKPVFQAGPDTLYLKKDSAFSYTVLASSRPKGYSAAGLQAGLGMDSCSGVISGTPSVAGTFPVTVTVSNNWGSTSDTVVMVVKATQTISFAALPAHTTRGADFAPGATASSGLSVSYTCPDSGVAVITSSGMIHIVGAGIARITAIQAGDSVYYAAAPVTDTLRVFMPPHVVARNTMAAVGANGTVVLAASQVDSGSVSYNGRLALRLTDTLFSCANIGTPMRDTLIGVDSLGYSDSATAMITVIDTLKPVLTCPASQDLCFSPSCHYTIPALQATDNCGVAGIVYSISGATTRTGTGGDASGSFNIGHSTITYTVTDGSGNQSTCSVSVTIERPGRLPGKGEGGAQVVVIYPNPNTGSFTIQLSHFDQGKVLVNIVDRLGVVVRQIPVTVGSDIQTVPVSLGRVVSGIYFVQVISHDGIDSQKILIGR